MFPFDAGRQGLDQSHESLELFEIKKRSETEAPKDRKRFDSEEVRVYDLAYLSEYLEGSHLLWSATKSLRRISRKLTITPGSLVLIPFIRGTTFS